MDKLEVFISWSGERANAVAKAIKDWLPDVVRNAQGWLSSEDLRKGLQWLPELNKNLNTTKFGLIVLTAENKNEPWLLFEAGVISKALVDKHCCPVLCDLKQTDIAGPLAQFQGTSLTVKDDMLKLVKTMNDACGSSRTEDQRLTKYFEKEWADFSRKTGEIITAKSTAPSPIAKTGPTDRDLLEEILQTTRRIAISSIRIGSTPTDATPKEGSILSSPGLSELLRMDADSQRAIIARLSTNAPLVRRKSRTSRRGDLADALRTLRAAQGMPDRDAKSS